MRKLSPTSSPADLGVATLSLELDTELEDEEEPALFRLLDGVLLTLVRGVPAWVGGVGSGRAFLGAATCNIQGFHILSEPWEPLNF